MKSQTSLVRSDGAVHLDTVAPIDLNLALVILPGDAKADQSFRLEHALKENGPGPLGDAARRMTRDAALWTITFANPGIVLGIMWNMTQKPGTVEAIAAVVIGYVVGAALAFRFTRAGTVAERAVVDPTA